MLSLFSKLIQYRKFIGILLLIIGMVFAYNLRIDSAYDKGYLDAQTEIQVQYNAEVEKMRKEYERNVQQALINQEREYQSEMERLKNEKKIIVRTNTVIDYVDKIVEVPAECDPLIIDVIRMLDEATGIIYAASDESSEGQNSN